MTNIVDKSGMYYISPERLKKFLEKEYSIVKNDENRQKKIMLPVDTIVNITMDDVRKIGNCCGIYVLITRSGKTYIGNSKNIRKRVVQQRRNREYMFDPIESIIIYVTEDIQSAKILEKTLIMDVRPDLNTILYEDVYNKTKYAIRNFFRYSRN